MITSLLSINLAYGLWLPQTPQELLEESQIVFAGTITSVNVLEFEESSTSYVEEDGIEKPVTENYILSLGEYSVNVEEFLKNPQNSTILTVRQPTTSIPGKIIPFGGFEVGDRVLFYLKEFDGINTYSKESFLVPKQCDPSSVIHEPRMIGGDLRMIQNGMEKQDNFTANYPIQFIAERDMGTLSGASISYDAYISKQVGNIYKERVFNQTITADSKPCQWLSVATWEFTPDAGNYLLNGRVYEAKSSFGINNTFFSVWPESPLKQINSGKTIDEIKCKENLVLIQKYDGSPACVTEPTKQKLVERGWVNSNDFLLVLNNNQQKTSLDDSKIDCNNQSNPHQEYECFKEAFSNCIPAKVNPEIYTIEGDPVYTTLSITSDCKIQGTADMSTDRFWGTPEIITTQCDKIIVDQYMWAIQNCDAKKLPEMQFNFGMQLYPQILECEENGNIWDSKAFACINETPHGNKSEQWKKYITVSASRIDESPLPDTVKVQHVKDFSEIQILSQLLNGADGCKDETEMCALPRGVSIDRTNPLGIKVYDQDDYTVSLDEEKANELLSKLEWTINEGWIYSVLKYEQKYYFVVLSTFDSVRTPDVKMRLIDTSLNPVKMEAGETLNYTIQLETWATYGPAAKIDLRAVQDAKDSGIKVWIEPEVLEIPERSNATATLFIQSSDDAKDGIYDVRVIGRANGNLADLYCSKTVCPTVNIGDSVWSISTFGSGSGRGIGGIETPENTWLDLDLNKKEFFDGEMAEIRAVLVNNSTEKITFTPNELLISVVKTEPVGYYENMYGIEARYESDEPITLEPNSKTLLVRPFYWNQTTFHNFEEEQRLDPKQYKIISKFVGDNYDWSGEAWVEIK